MRTKATTLLIMILLTLSAHAEVKILSTKSWSPTITGSWNKDVGLTYSNTVYGDTYYNPNWQDMSKSGNLESLSVTRYFYLRPNNKRSWTFSIPITNLHAEKGYSYYAQSSPNKKQSSDQIYWAIVVGYKENGVSRTSKIWIKRSNREYYSGGYEAYGSEQYISYSIDNNGWKKSYTDYPSCSPNNSPSLKIETYSYGHTYLKWGNFSLTDFPVYMEELVYIQVWVGTQAKIQIGKPSAWGDGVNEKNIYVAADYMEQENYAMVKQKLYKSNGEYYEGQAANLAFAYAALNEIDKALELCNALIKFNGESLQYAYWLRGSLKEYKGQKLDALDDYQRAGDQESYTRLYNEIYRPKPAQQNPSKHKQQNSGKPALTK